MAKKEGVLPKKSVAATRAPGGKRTIVRGDNLSRLVRQVYGRNSDLLIEQVKQTNPQVKDPNLIYEGDTLVFPNSTPGQDAPSNADRSSP